jgi:hypothetical protein
MAFLVGGLLLKGGMVLLWNFIKSPILLGLYTRCDPGAFWLANHTTSLLFDQRREIPAPAEPAAFVALLILGFGLECLLVGLAVQAFVARKRGAATPGLAPSAGRVP